MTPFVRLRVRRIAFAGVVLRCADDFFDAVFGDEISGAGAALDAELGEVQQPDEGPKFKNPLS
jgi:hypothetical protein